MDYFYVPPGRISKETLSIEGDEFSHLTHVMRKEAGDVITVVDGLGNLYVVTITEIARRTALCGIRSHSFRSGEPGVRLHLGVGILKNSSRFDYLVEKATELGVGTITPLLTQRTIPQHAKVERWQKIALAAMKQSGRSVLPTVSDLTSLPEFIRAAAPDARKLIPHMTGEGEVMPALQHAGEVVVCIGPEGGFSEEEVGVAIETGFSKVSLGPLRLRTETAAVVVAAKILTR